MFTVRITSLFALWTASLLLVGCSSIGSPSATPAPSGSTTAPTPSAIVNVWAKPGGVAVTAIPLGDGKFSTNGPAAGTIYSCQPASPNAPGAQAVGPWVHGTTWNAVEKVAVAGAVTWPTAMFKVSTNAGQRTITTNDLPVNNVTGSFPVTDSDPAAAYDKNPNAISAALAFTFTLPISPHDSASPNCLGMGAIGMLLNGVLLFNAVDARGDDAVAHEVQDVCQGHPQDRGSYHYHDVPTCLRDNATGSSTVVGWAVDGYPIVVERDAAGELPNNGDLDRCHGRTSPILLDGQVVAQYHYSATLEYPYTVGCLAAPATAN